jgi:dihydrofolate reductase
MGKIVISTNATLDGVVQDPDGQEGFERGGWFHRCAGEKDLEDWVVNETKEALRAEALLLGNTTVLARDVVEEVSALKRRVDGDILVYGSQQLVRTLMARNLADELRLVVFPVVLGGGRRLFDGTSDGQPLRLVDTRRIGDGLVHHTYAFAPASTAMAL